jgi:hypothetical protein
VPGYPAGYPPGPVAVPPRRSGKKLLIAAALLLTAAVIAGALAAWLMSGVFRAQPPAAAQFPSGGSTSAELRAGEAKMIYVDNAGSPPQRVGCRGAAPGSATSAVRIEPGADEITVNNWRAAFTVTAAAPGTYAFTCTGSPGDIFGVGGPATGGRIGSSVALILLAGATGLAGLITGSCGGSNRPKGTRHDREAPELGGPGAVACSIPDTG